MSDQPQITHAFEQMTAFARDFTGVVEAYFKGLVTRGFTREEALALTRGWQQETLRRIRNGSGGAT